MVTGVVYACPKCGQATKGCMLDQPCRECQAAPEDVYPSEAVEKFRDEIKKEQSLGESLKTKNSNLFRKLACFIGAHSTETRTIYVGVELNSQQPLNLNYSVCQFCLEGHPFVTGEW